MTPVSPTCALAHHEYENRRLRTVAFRGSASTLTVLLLSGCRWSLALRTILARQAPP